MGLLSHVIFAVVAVLVSRVGHSVLSFDAADARTYVNGEANVPSLGAHVQQALTPALLAAVAAWKRATAPAGADVALLDECPSLSVDARTLLTMLRADRNSLDDEFARGGTSAVAAFRSKMSLWTLMLVSAETGCTVAPTWLPSWAADGARVRFDTVRFGADAADDRQRPRAALLHVHGGGYYAGSARNYRGYACELARATGVDVLLADQRIAPEAQMPVAVDDVLAMYAEARRRYARVGLAGDSAGGGMVMHVFARLGGVGTPAHAAKHTPLPPPPDAMYMSSPALNIAVDFPSFRGADEREVMLPRAAVWLDYPYSVFGGCVLRDDVDATECAPSGSDEATPAQVARQLASPTRWPGSHCCGALRAVPPTLIVVGGHEMLLDDAHAIAKTLRNVAGADAAAADTVELHVAPCMFHVHELLAPTGLPEAVSSFARVAALVRRMAASA